MYCGGWTLVAKHKDSLGIVSIKEFIDKNTFGVLSDSRWKAITSNYQYGMLFIDENGLISKILKDLLESEHACLKLSVSSLLNSQGIFHYETSVAPCDGNMDYAYIALRNTNDGSDASLWNLADKKFDIWPYSSNISYSYHNELEYYIK